MNHEIHEEHEDFSFFLVPSSFLTREFFSLSKTMKKEQGKRKNALLTCLL